jgi:hypothetical protein
VGRISGTAAVNAEEGRGLNIGLSIKPRLRENQFIGQRQNPITSHLL